MLCELTSTHLCYMEHSPQVAVVTCLWPDHVELHGSVERYVAAKARILAAQQPGDLALLGPGCDPLVGIGAARQLRFEGDPAEAVARALGIDTAAIAAGCAADLALPHRFHELGARDGVRVIDDGMAATPAKSTAALRRLAGERVVLLAGGHDQAGVHRAGAEVAMLDAACQAAAACRAVVVFGSAAERLRGRIPGAVVATDLEAAIDAGVRLAKVGDVLLLAPMFPLTMEERQSFATRFQG